MGSGPSSYVARKFNPRALILMSAFCSVREAAKNVAGGFLGFFVAKSFDNLTEMKQIQCPVILIHGKSDTLIPYEHSQNLFNQL